MKALIFSVIGAGMLCSTVLAAGPPFAPQSVQIASSAYQHDFVRFRLTVSGSEATRTSNVVVGSISVCSDVMCFRPYIPNPVVELYNTSEGKSQTVVELSLPRKFSKTIQSIHFEKVAGQNTLAGDVKLPIPLEVPGDIQAAEALVIVQRDSGPGATGYKPTVAVGGLFHPERQSIYYSPAFTTTAKLPFNATLTIPAGATTTPQIFTVAIHDTGESYPMVDLYPVVEFRVPAALSLPRTARVAGALGSGSSSLGSAQLGGNLTPSGTKTVSLRATGVIKPSAVRTQSLGPDAATTAATAATAPATTAAVTDTCVNFIAQVRQSIANALTTNPAAYLTGCVDQSPFVHIVVAKNSSSHKPRIIWEWAGTGVATLRLRRLEDLWSNDVVRINGFTWAGDTGITSGTGRALGFVQQGYLWGGFELRADVLGTNTVGGGIGPGTLDGNKFAAMVQYGGITWGEGRVGPLFPAPYDSTHMIISSSTSIVKNGQCTTYPENNRWSAFGATRTGELVYLSSTMETTPARDLCPVFQALGVDNALLLDGSTAAGIMVNSVRRNPLTGRWALAMGSSRHIAYRLTQGWLGKICKTRRADATAIKPTTQIA